MLKFKNLHKSITEVANEFESMVDYTIPVDTGRLKRSGILEVYSDRFIYHAEEYIHYLKTLYTIQRTDGRQLSGSIVSSITRDTEKHLPTFYEEQINVDKVNKAIKKDIDEWLEQRLK